MKFYLSIFFCFTTIALAMGQNEVSIAGTVIDSQGEAIAQAVVALENTKHNTYTDNDGKYFLQTKKGKYSLVISAFGYNTIRKNIDLSRVTKMDFVMEENSISLNEVEILGQSNSKKIQQKVYTATNLDIRPITTSLNNLNTLISRSTGIRIREEGGVGSDFNLSINGLSGNAVRYFIDGVPLSALGNSVSLANLPVNLVERIEIFKGVVPTELGEDALGGAINIITRQNRSNYVDVSTGVGSFHTYKTDFNAQYIHKKTGFTIRPSFGFNLSKNNYIMRDVEIWDESAYEYINVDKRRFHDAYKSAFARLEAGFTNRKWADEAFISTSYSTENKEIQTGRKQSIVIGEATREKESLNLLARYAKRNFLTNNLTARFLFSYTHDHTLITDTAFKIYAWDGTWMPTHFSEVSRRGKSIRHYVQPQIISRANFNYFIDELRSLNLNYMLNMTGNKRYDDFDSEFIPTNDQLHKHFIGLTYNRLFWNERLNTSVFVKDYIFHASLKQNDLYWITGINDMAPSTTRNNISYGAGGRFTIVPALTCKASYERSVRLPVSREFLGNGITVYPNFKLKPEIAHNINLGFFGEWNPQKRHKISYETNLFVRKVQDYILRLPEGENQSQYRNVAAATVKGIEGEISYEYNNIFRAKINASYLEERNKNQMTIHNKPDPTYNNRLPNRPWAFANAELGWNKNNPFGVKNSRLHVDYTCRYIQWFYLTWEAFGTPTSKEVIPTQFAHDAVVSWSFAQDKYSLSLECTNIFDNKLYDNYMLQKPGRAFFAKFRVFIN